MNEFELRDMLREKRNEIKSDDWQIFNEDDYCSFGEAKE